jgi:hypothetical protein
MAEDAALMEDTFEPAELSATLAFEWPVIRDLSPKGAKTRQD